jgi:hypothetical protein
MLLPGSIGRWSYRGFNRRRHERRCFLGFIAPAVAPAATTFAPAIAVNGMLHRALGDDDRVGLGLAFALGTEGFVLRLFLLADRRNPDRWA